jgi:hypothetical protein
MTIKKVEIYVADDGREFANFEECASYEREFSDIVKALKKLKEKCISTDADECESCPFFKIKEQKCGFYSFPSHWAI